MSRRRDVSWGLWGAPIALGLVTLVGLLAGLVGDGGWDLIAWIGLGIPVLACAWYGWLRRAPGEVGRH